MTYKYMGFLISYIYICMQRERAHNLCNGEMENKNTNSINENTGKRFKEFKMNTMARNSSFLFC